jgi:hypothetical protein
MMGDPGSALALAAFAMFALAAISLAGLRGWRGWLDLKRLELASASAERLDRIATPSPAARIELADLKERVRKLEAIANGEY